MSVQLNNFIYILNFWNFDLVGNSKVLEDFFFCNNKILFIIFINDFIDS